MKKCTFCKQQAPDDANECPHCGHAVVDPSSPPKTKYCISEKTMVYSASSLESLVVAEINSGDEIEVGGLIKNDEEWHDVRLSDGRTGFILAKTKGHEVVTKTKWNRWFFLGIGLLWLLRFFCLESFKPGQTLGQTLDLGNPSFFGVIGFFCLFFSLLFFIFDRKK